jgi:hypothetical protein
MSQNTAPTVSAPVAPVAPVAPAAPVAPKAPAAPKAPKRFNLAEVADAPAKAAAQVDLAVATAASVGLPVPDAGLVAALRSHAGREAALAQTATEARGRISAKGGVEAAARFDWKTVAQKAGADAFLPSLIAGAALVAVAATYRRNSAK